jgi:uncharacterized protein (DUF1800 family)
LWRRAGFGARRETIARSVALGLEATLDEIFATHEHDTALRDGIRPLLSLGKIESLQAWWMALILADRAPLMERVALSWHGHFATSWDKVQDVRTMHAQIELFRNQGLGDFRRLLHGVARDAAMLVWLDGERNRRGQPNENFARELLELFALGIGNYDESDIQEGARAFTGWRVEERRAVFRKADHDPGVKEIFGARDHYDAEQAVELVLAHPACPRHVARRLVKEFIAPEPAESDVRAWAAVLLEEDWNIGRTLRRMFISESFFAARRTRIAAPVELIAGTLISLETSVAPLEAARAAESMGQSLYRPPNVKGWPGGRNWIHAGSWIARHNHLTDWAAKAELFDEVVAAEAVVEPVLDLLLPDYEDEAYRKTLHAAASECDDAAQALREVLTLVLTSPEYHLI